MRSLSLCVVLCWLFSMALAEDVVLPVKRDNLAPNAPAKVVRYATMMMQRYDKNGDGILQREEWEAMPGNPQAIDIDGNGEITQSELVWHLAQYGRTRTIHRTVVVNLSDPYKFDPANLRLFSPALPRTAPAAVSATETQNQEDDGTDDVIKSNEQLLDDDVYQKMLEARQIPAERPYHVLPEKLRGVPAWFILLDKDGDGQISLKEFAPTLSPARVNLFKKLDKNGNGLIEPDEVRNP